MRCCVPLCKNTLDKVSTAEEDGEGISFHGFPSDEHLRAAWLRALGKQDSHLPDSAVVCSQHFLNGDIYETECGLRQIVTGAIPSTVQVCMMCLDTDSKLILMNKHRLEETYEKLTGHPLCDQGNLKQSLCVQCAHRLINFSRFRDKSLRARALMMDLVEKHQLITRRHIKMINRTKHQLKSSMVLTTLGPDHCDLHILEHPSEDKQTELQEIEPRDVVKTEESDDSMLVDVEVEVMKHEEDNNVNDFVQDPLKYESVSFQCTLCLEEFVHEHEYMQHLGVHFQNSDTDGERGTSQVCKPHPAVSSNSSHSSLITENKQADPSPCAQVAHTTVVPPSTSLVTKMEINPTEEVYNTNISRGYKRFDKTDCFVKLYDIFAKKVVPRQDRSQMKTQSDAMSCDSLNTVSEDLSHQATSRNEVPKTGHVEPVTNSSGRVKVIVSNTLPINTYCMNNVINIQCINSSLRSSHICDICGKNYKRKSFLVKHINTHVDVRQVTCKICQRECKFKSNLARHMRTHTREKPFTCNICNTKFAQKSHLVCHLRTHTGIKPYSCELCEYKCVQKSCLVRHMRIHTGEKPFTCDICNSKFAHSSVLACHMSTHTGMKPYACELCEYKCAQRSNLVCHMRKHTGEKSNSCQICEYKYADKRSLVVHMTSHAVAPVSATFATNNEYKLHTTKEDDAENKVKRKLGGLQNTSVNSKIFTNCEVRLCDIFKKPKALRQDQALTKTRNSISGIQNIASIDFSHQATSRNEAPKTEYIEPVTNSRSRVKVTVSKTLQSKTDDINNIQCNNSSQYSSHTAKSSFISDICEKKIKRKSLLVKHVNTNAEERRFTCKICQHKFKYKSDLTAHMRTHTGEKPFTCNICNSKFAQRNNLVCHMRTHTGIKPYACELCQYKCAQKIHLIIHMSTHTGIKPYACELCEYKGANKSNLVNHMRTHANIKPYVCELCEYRSAQKSNLTIHMSTHTDIKPYACELCEYRSAKKSYLTIHMRTHTGIKPYACELCDYKCSQKSDLVRHMRIHTGEKPYCCQICEYKCADKSNLLKHKMRTHTGNT